MCEADNTRTQGGRQMCVFRFMAVWEWWFVSSQNLHPPNPQPGVGLCHSFSLTHTNAKHTLHRDPRSLSKDWPHLPNSSQSKSCTWGLGIPQNTSGEVRLLFQNNSTDYHKPTAFSSVIGDTTHVHIACRTQWLPPAVNPFVGFEPQQVET